MPTSPRADTPHRMSAALRVEGLHKQFRGNHVLRGTSFEIRRGRITALIGSNGAGKSTLLNVISGLTSADAGRILLNGRDITHDTPYRRARGGIARTFQHPRAFRSLDVRDCVRLGATAPADETLTRGLMHALRGFGGPPVETATLDEILLTCRLARRAGQRAADLSYSEQKLLMLAQVLAGNREILCFDELCAGLEPGAVGHVADIFRTLSAGGRTVLFVEHNLQLVRDLADWVIFLHEGITYREGLRDAVLGDPDVIKLYLGQ